MRTFATLLLLVFPLAAQDSSGSDEPDPDAAKPLRPYVVLGRRQLFDAQGGLARHERRRRAKSAAELRAETIAELKKIAAEEQPGITKALGEPEVLARLWIVNALVVRMTEEQAAEAVKRESVLWAYPAGIVRPAGDAGTVSEVIERAERKPLSVEGKRIPWNIRELSIPAAWKRGATGEGVVVAMFDAGVNYSLGDLRNNMWINPDEVPNNGKDDDKNGYVDDLYGFHFTLGRAEVKNARIHHGTLTSSIVAGDGTGGQITGVAPRARLMALIAHGGPYNAARAFQYALDEGAHIVNMSFSIPKLGDTRGLWRRMAQHATAAGLLLISGAGNFPKEPPFEQIRVPEGIPCVLCVGGVTREKKFAAFTSRGPVTWEGVKFYDDFPRDKPLIKPDLVAFPGPGCGLIRPRKDGYLPENNRFRGNSLSAPHVAGVAALVLSVHPDLKPWEVREILEKSARDLGPEGKDPETGWGLVDAAKAVEAALARKKG